MICQGNGLDQLNREARPPRGARRPVRQEGRVTGAVVAERRSRSADDGRGSDSESLCTAVPGPPRDPPRRSSPAICDSTNQGPSGPHESPRPENACPPASSFPEPVFTQWWRPPYQAPPIPYQVPRLVPEQVESPQHAAPAPPVDELGPSVPLAGHQDAGEVLPSRPDCQAPPLGGSTISLTETASVGPADKPVRLREYDGMSEMWEAYHAHFGLVKELNQWSDRKALSRMAVSLKGDALDCYVSI